MTLRKFWCERCLSWKPQTRTRTYKHQRNESLTGVSLSLLLVRGVFDYVWDNATTRKTKRESDGGKNSQIKKEMERMRENEGEEWGEEKSNERKEREAQEREKDVIWLVHRWFQRGKDEGRAEGLQAGRHNASWEVCMRSNGSKERHGVARPYGEPTLAISPRVTSREFCGARPREDDFIAFTPNRESRKNRQRSYSRSTYPTATDLCCAILFAISCIYRSVQKIQRIFSLPAQRCAESYRVLRKKIDRLRLSKKSLREEENTGWTAL